jgi:hypothetical protein
LVEHQYLASWDIEKTADKKDFKIVFYHGLKFYADRAKAKRLLKKHTDYKNPPSDEVSGSVNPNSHTQGKKPVRGQNLPVNDVSKQQSNHNTALSTDEQERLSVLVNDFLVSEQKGRELIQNHGQSVIDQLAYYPQRAEPKNKSGYIIKAIEENYAPPASFVKEQKLRKQREEEDRERRRLEKESEEFLARQERGEELYKNLSDKKRQSLTQKHERQQMKEGYWKTADLSKQYNQSLFAHLIKEAVIDELLSL